ncbi:MAG TPA: hypothetical protein VGQ36_28570 [Thermoanaerobaculia bacterium]|jgi:hypothetical protein|nr:hypothetical protein [Thermoanaerobaculia bacterium]
MKRQSIALLLALGLSASCATQRPDGPERAPRVKIEQVGDVLVMGVAPSGGIPMEYRLTIENPFDHEVKLRSVEIETVGQSGGYSMNRVRHPFDETIAARASHELSFRAWIRVLTEGETRSVDHPVMLRGTARFDSSSGGMTRNFFARANETARTKTVK